MISNKTGLIICRWIYGRKYSHGAIMLLGLLRWSSLSLKHLALEEMTGLHLVVTHVMHVCGLRLCVWPVLHPVNNVGRGMLRPVIKA